MFMIVLPFGTTHERYRSARPTARSAWWALSLLRLPVPSIRRLAVASRKIPALCAHTVHNNTENIGRDQQTCHILTRFLERVDEQYSWDSETIMLIVVVLDCK